MNDSHSNPAAQPFSARGGPRTVAGKDASRRNALRHGLSASKLLPPQRIMTERQRLAQYLKPDNPIEDILVDEMARHAVVMELGQQAEGAVLRHGAKELAAVTLSTEMTRQEHDDAILTAAVATPALDQLSRYRRTHEKGFFTALNKLHELRLSAAAKDTAPTTQLLCDPYQNEATCQDFLRQRFTQFDWQCPQCGEASGSWLSNRRCWECADCGRQVGLRAGTVMAKSALALRAWFQAIRLLAARPEADGATVSRVTGITRTATLTSLMARITAALNSPQRRVLLCGVDTIALTTTLPP